MKGCNDRHSHPLGGPCTDNTAPGILPHVVRNAEQHAIEVGQDGRKACAHTGRMLTGVVILVKLLLAERAQNASERERELLQLLVNCDRVATRTWGDPDAGLSDCEDYECQPYQSAQLAQVLETARAILEPVVVHDEVPS